MASNVVEAWVSTEFRERYCDKAGKRIAPVNLDKLYKKLIKTRPKDATAIMSAIQKLSSDICSETCRQFSQTDQGTFQDHAAVVAKLLEDRPDMSKAQANSAITIIEKQNVKPAQIKVKAPVPHKLEPWIHQQYLAVGFNHVGFIGWKKFTENLKKQKPKEAGAIQQIVDRLRTPGNTYSFEDPASITQSKAALKKQDGGIQLSQAPVNGGGSKKTVPDDKAQALRPVPQTPVLPAKITATPKFTSTAQKSKPPKLASPTSHTNIPKERGEVDLAKGDLLARKMNLLDISSGDQCSSGTGSGSEDSCDEESVPPLEQYMRGPDFEQIDVLLADKTVVGADFDDRSGGIDAEIRHAPLISGDMIMKSSSELLPQYGFLGSHSTGNVESPESKVFLNTNVPFSAFICGVQGSGKSHTTSCILENALLPSRHLGRLENPVSALVFSYGDFSSGGVGFSISEAAFLAGPNAAFPGHSRVKKITVLTSPTNNAIRKRYERLPNVRAIPFTLDPRSLDIGNMLTLMAVNESAATPLYMAKIESILRDMARESEDSVFDYLEFKERLKLCEFMPAQSVALEQRLGVLESFLDMSGNAPQPKFRPGEVTIIDLSCPFVSANTACILFKICLQRYLQSQASGKMVVLDEAHKYMLNVPGARLLNDYLVSIIRLQRHYGARVVISTQEPTLLTDLIALCSVTVIHRFTSPEWYNALRKHISIAADDKHETLRRIETLTTGTALVYSSNAVLGKTEDGFLIKGDGRLLKLDIRKRVTSDGGQSVMSV